MTHLNFGELKERSKAIRDAYHNLEVTHHGAQWTVIEDALAFLTDAGLVGRLTMANQDRWPDEETGTDELEHKLGESIWWICVLASRMNIDIDAAVQQFLTKTEGSLDIVPLG